MTKKYTLISIFTLLIIVGMLYVVLIMNSDKNIMKTEETIYSLNSNFYSLCEFFENSSPSAHLYFAYVKDGVPNYLETKTTCEDFPKKYEPLNTRGYFGEKLVLYPNATNPKIIKRADGTVFKVRKIDKSVYRFFIDSYLYVNPKEYQPIGNDRLEILYTQCNELTDPNYHKNCLSYYDQLKALQN